MEEDSKYFIYIDGSDLHDVHEGIIQSLSRWIPQNELKISLVNDQYERTPDLPDDCLPDWNLGINFESPNQEQMQSILTFLNDVGNKYKRDFVLGYYLPSKGISEDFAFFGYECGPPNINQICNALRISS